MVDSLDCFGPSSNVNSVHLKGEVAFPHQCGALVLSKNNTIFRCLLKTHQTGKHVVLLIYVERGPFNWNIYHLLICCGHIHYLHQPPFSPFYRSNGITKAHGYSPHGIQSLQSSCITSCSQGHTNCVCVYNLFLLFSDSLIL